MIKKGLLKKLVALSMVAIMSLAFVGCGEDSSSDKEDKEIETEADEEAEEVTEEETEEAEGAYTVGDMISQLKDYEKKLDLEFKPIVIEDKEYIVTGLAWDKDADDKVTAEIMSKVSIGIISFHGVLGESPLTSEFMWI